MRTAKAIRDLTPRRLRGSMPPANSCLEKMKDDPLATATAAIRKSANLIESDLSILIIISLQASAACDIRSADAPPSVSCLPRSWP